MALAFAGPLSRFFAREAADAARLRVGVEAWRSDLRASVADKLGTQLVWDEGSAVACTAELGDAGWMALRLFAFYAERSELELPDTVPPLLELDAQWRAAVDAKFGKSRFGHLLACRVWLPGDFPVTIKAPLPDGETAEIGSVDVLADQLRRLNEQTFAADVAAVASWSTVPAPPGGDLLDAAKRGYAGLWAAVAAAVRARVPVIVREV